MQDSGPACHGILKLLAVALPAVVAGNNIPYSADGVFFARSASRSY
jgi:hypothetical protein